MFSQVPEHRKVSLFGVYISDEYSTGQKHITTNSGLYASALGYKKTGRSQVGVCVECVMASQMFSSSWNSLKKLKFVKIVPLIFYSILKILVDCDDKSLHTFPVVVLTITFQGNKPFYMPIVCILSQPFRKSKESEKLNEAKKSREDWGSPIFVPVSLRFFPAFYISRSTIWTPGTK